MKSINQINSFCDKNQTIEFYWQLRRQMYEYNLENRNYRVHSYNFNEKKDGTGKFSHFPMSNFIYNAAQKELDLYTGFNSRGRDARRDHLRVNNGVSDVKIQVCLSLDFDGVYIEFIDFDRRNYLPKKSRVKSNEGFFELDFLKYAENLLKKELFAEGFFRDIQIANNCTKKGAIELYRIHLAEEKMPLSEYDLQWNEQKASKSIRRHLKRHYRILADGYWSNYELLFFRRRYGKQKRFTQIEPFPHFSLDGFDGDIDELESEIYELTERSVPTIFI